MTSRCSVQQDVKILESRKNNNVIDEDEILNMVSIDCVNRVVWRHNELADTSQ